MTELTDNNSTTEKKWIRIPEPGQFRGEGIWREVGPDDRTQVSQDYYDFCKDTNYLPVHEGETPPLEQEQQ